VLDLAVLDVGSTLPEDCSRRRVFHDRASPCSCGVVRNTFTAANGKRKHCRNIARGIATHFRTREAWLASIEWIAVRGVTQWRQSARGRTMRSLVIEDEPQIGIYIGRLLGQLNGIVDIVTSISDAEQALANFRYDLAIVDRMLPDGDALDIVVALSGLPERPAIIMLTAKDAKEDVIAGLNSGADDYLIKPFEPQEFIARVRAVLRRPRLPSPSVLSFGNVELNVGTNEAIVADTKVLLRRREALILEALLVRRDRVVTRNDLIEAIYGFDDEIESNTLDAQVSRLRKKLAELGGNVEIRSMRGIGYILRPAQPL
jgi:two-component system OmpR family response regulator